MLYIFHIHVHHVIFCDNNLIQQLIYYNTSCVFTRCDNVFYTWIGMIVDPLIPVFDFLFQFLILPFQFFTFFLYFFHFFFTFFAHFSSFLILPIFVFFVWSFYLDVSNTGMFSQRIQRIDIISRIFFRIITRNVQAMILKLFKTIFLDRVFW